LRLVVGGVLELSVHPRIGRLTYAVPVLPLYGIPADKALIHVKARVGGSFCQPVAATRENPGVFVPEIFEKVRPIDTRISPSPTGAFPMPGGLYSTASGPARTLIVDLRSPNARSWYGPTPPRCAASLDRSTKRFTPGASSRCGMTIAAG